MSKSISAKAAFTLYTSLFALIGATQAHAEPAPDAADENAAETAEIVLVEPLRDYVYSYGQRRQHPSTVGSSASVITAEAIELAQDVFVADALKRTPGVAVARNGGHGGFASARIRGGASGQTLVVIDGAVVNDAAAPQGGFNFANLDVADIGQIEILRGPQSLIWGADAIGGVIYITSREDGPALSAYAEGGARSSFRGGARLAGEIGSARLRATISGLTTDGISRAASGVEEDGYRSLSASLSAATPVGDIGDLNVAARISDSRADLDGFPPPTFAFADTAEREDTTDYAIAARFSHGAPGKIDGALTLGVSGVDRVDEDNGVETFAAKGARMNARYLLSFRASDAVRFTAGGEVKRSSAKVSGVDEAATAGAAFAFAEAYPFSNLVLSAGLRRDEFSNFEGATTARVASVLTLAEQGPDALRLRASWGQGFRAPTLFELNFDQFGIIPNPNLRPERAYGFDFGIEKTFSGASLRATYFRQRVKDQIDFDFLGNGYFNIDRVKSDGVEVEAAFEPFRFLRTELVYTHVDARDALTGAAILRTPRHSGSASLFLSPTERLELSSTLYLNGKEADFPTPNKAFARLDLRASYKATDALSVYGRIENATDANYQDVSEFGEPGLSAFAGLRFAR